VADAGGAHHPQQPAHHGEQRRPATAAEVPRRKAWHSD